MAITSLVSRRLIRIKGQGVLPFLQGLITQDINLLNSQKIAAALFLNPKGRLISDCLIVKQSVEDDVLIDLPKENTDTIANMLIRHRLRLPLSIDKITDISAHVVTGDDPNSIADPRGPFLLNRVYSESREYDPVLEKSYRKARLFAGIIEGAEIGADPAIPIFFNFDLFNCISFNKGCYTGQELITRTLRRGVVRKRLFPITVDDGQTLASGEPVMVGSSQIGTILAAQDNVGVALCQLGDALNETSQVRESWTKIDPKSVSVGSLTGATLHLPKYVSSQ